MFYFFYCLERLRKSAEFKSRCKLYVVPCYCRNNLTVISDKVSSRTEPHDRNLIERRQDGYFRRFFFLSPGVIIIILRLGDGPWQRWKRAKNRFVLLLKTKGYFDVTKVRNYGRHVWVKETVIISKAISNEVKNHLPIVNQNCRGSSLRQRK